jgi:hypothetical protein
MTLTRRTFTTGLAVSALAVASGVGALPVLAQSFDVEDFHKAPEIGDKTLGPMMPRSRLSNMPRPPARIAQGSTPPPSRR